ncbi:MAG: 1-acyl-sn-glycerol-3-phosphate acyltransferase [Gemmatimonadota bacterium]|jgi:1-acyl-sn-glycerol-3-phosphate acyltransferase
MVFRWFMRRWALAALWFRFRKKQMVFHASPPLERGAILAVNHQNAVLDSITLAAISPKTPFTLSRASLFDHPILRLLLPPLQMIPIFRFRDGFGKMRRNPEALRQFSDLLRDGEWLAIYPEGSHLIKHTLRPLQKGVARIVFAAQEAQGWDREVPIIPVGLQYEHHTHFGARLLIQFGSTISSLDFKEAHAENARRAERELTDRVFEGIKPLLILPPQDEAGYQAAVERMEANRGRFTDLMDQFRSDQEVVAEVVREGVEAGSPSGVGGSEGGGRPVVSRRESGLKRLLGQVLSLPGQLLHLPAILIAGAVVAISTNDTHLAPSTRFLTGMFLFPVWYLVVAALIHLQFRSLALDLLGLLVMPSSLWLWSRFGHWKW